MSTHFLRAISRDSLAGGLERRPKDLGVDLADSMIKKYRRRKTFRATTDVRKIGNRFRSSPLSRYFGNVNPMIRSDRSIFNGRRWMGPDSFFSSDKSDEKARFRRHALRASRVHRPDSQAGPAGRGGDEARDSARRGAASPGRGEAP